MKFVLSAFLLISVFFINTHAESAPHAFHSALRLSDGEMLTFQEMLLDLSNTDIIFVGEFHDNKRHHDAQLDIIRAFADAGYPVSIALEMFQAGQQHELDMWVGGRLGTETFQQIFRSYWPASWSLYRDIFTFARQNRIPMIGLNVPKEITRKVSRSGIQSLTPEESRQLPPDITCEDIDERYMDFIQRAFEGHDTDSRDFIHFCQAQRVWDKTMAWNLLDYADANPGRLVIVLAGTAHSWKRGIPEYVRNYSAYSYVVIIPEEAGKMDPMNMSYEDTDYILLD